MQCFVSISHGFSSVLLLLKMIRTTVFCILAVLALGQGVLSSVSTPDNTTTPDVKSASNTSSTQDSSVLPTVPNPQAVSSSTATPATKSISKTTSTPATTSTTASESSPTVTISNVLQTSFTPKPVPVSATPTLTSSSMASTTLAVHSSSVMTSTAAPSIAPSPAPTALPYEESVQFNDAHNNTLPCLSAKLKVDFVISYNSTIQRNGTRKDFLNTTTIPLNGLEKPSGECSYANKTAYFQFKWNERGNSEARNAANAQHTFRMDFELNTTTSTWTVSNVAVEFQKSDPYAFYNPDDKNGSVKANYDGTDFGSRKTDTNYVCHDGIQVPLSDDVKAKFENIVLDVFSRGKNKHKDYCPADKSDDDEDDNTVPIAVGAALGGLVLIVLVAYIIGRRRSNRGYEQV